jgi:hypothetical protein
VTTGLASGALVEVFGDLQAGDEVAVRGIDEIRGGREVGKAPETSDFVTSTDAIGAPSAARSPAGLRHIATCIGRFRRLYFPVVSAQLRAIDLG